MSTAQSKKGFHLRFYKGKGMKGRVLETLQEADIHLLLGLLYQDHIIITYHGNFYSSQISSFKISIHLDLNSLICSLVQVHLCLSSCLILGG